MAKNHSAVEFDKLKREARMTSRRKRVRRSAYDTIIQEARVKYDLHMKSDHKLCIAHPGLSLSMKKVEGFLLEMMLHLGNMQAPVMCREGLELANSLWLEELQHKKKS